MATISTHNGGGKANRDHNIRNPKVVSKEPHIDPNGHYEIWRDVRPREAYRRLFGDAVQEFNARQRHADRRIKDYYGAICQDGKKHAVYELIVAVGNRNEPVDEEIGKKIMREYIFGNGADMKPWKDRNPHLVIIGAYYHADEQGVPHVHIDYVPTATDCKRGMRVQNSLTQALNQQGFQTSSSKQTAQICWERSENQHLERLCNIHGITVEHPDLEEKRHLETKAYQLEQDVERLKAEVEELQNHNEVLIDENTALRNSLETLEERSEGFREHVKQLRTEINTLQEEKSRFEGIVAFLKEQATHLREIIEGTYKAGVEKGFSRENMTALLERRRRESFIEKMGLTEQYERFCKNPNSIGRKLSKSDKADDRPLYP